MTASDDPELALLAQVLAEPDDEAARAVLADWYLERGDLRGEVLARPQGVAPLQRTLLGALYTVTTTLHWDRGLLRAVTLAADDVAPPEVWARAVEHPWLAALRTIARGAASAERYRAFVASPRAVHVEEVVAPDVATFDALVAHPRPRLAHLVLEHPHERIVAALRARAAVLPALARLTLVTTKRNLEAVIKTWTTFVRPGVDVVLRVPEGTETERFQRALVRWLRRDAARAAIVELGTVDYVWLRLRWFEDEAEVRMEAFQRDALPIVDELAPARLVLAPLYGGSELPNEVEQFRNPVCTYAPLPAYRALLGRFPDDRLRFEGAFARLAGNASSRPT